MTLLAPLEVPDNRPCGQCGHPTGEHFRGSGSCLRSTEDVVWACGCDWWYPPRDPDWAGVYARVYPIKTGWTVRIDLPEADDRGAAVSFFYLVSPDQVTRAYGGWTPLLDGFVQSIDRFVKGAK